jgi:transposase InsO family protein
MNVVMSGMRNQGPVVCGAVSAGKLILKPDSQIMSVSIEELKEKQVGDEIVGPVHRAVLAGCRPGRKEWADLSHASKILMRSFGKLTVKDGVLLRKTLKYLQIVLPSDFHQVVYKELHEKMGHLGVEKVVDLAQQRFYWPKMAEDIKHHIRSKCRCVAAKKPNVKERAPLNPIEAQYPFQMISVDFTELQKCKGNYRYGLVVIDHFTRFSQFYATRNKSARAAADKLFNEFILQFGLPERIHHDQGREFNNKLFTELHRFTGIKSSNTTPYHPMGDGQVERQNRTLGNMLKALSKNEKKDWRKHMAKLAFACNSTVNKSTGFSPHFLMFGREAKLPIDLVFQEVGIQTVEGQSHEKFAKEWEDSMKKAYEIAKTNIRKSAGYNKKHYDQKARTVEIKVGDLVLVRNLREKGGRGSGKLRNYWEEKIFKVIEVKENVPVYTIKNVKKSKDIRTLHRNHLMKVELPLDIFDEKKEQEKPKKKKKDKNLDKKDDMKPMEEVKVPKEDSEDSDVELVFEMVSVNKEGEGSVGDQRMSREENESDRENDQGTVARSDDEPQVEEDLEAVGESENEQQRNTEGDTGESNDNEQVVQESGEETESAVEDESSSESEREQSESANSEDGQSSEDSSDDDDAPRRRVSSRTRIPKKVLTYNELGGNPTLVEQR